MTPLRVLITFDLDQALVERLRAAAGDRAIIEVLPQRARRAFREASFPDEDAARAARRELHERLREADVLYAGNRLPGDLYERAPNLRWIQVTSAGVDRLLARGLISDRVILTNSSGLHATAIGEWVLGAMLAMAKRFPALVRAQERREWRRDEALGELRGATCGIIGMGAIGEEVARLASAFGMRVLGMRRSATRREEREKVTVLPPGDLPFLLAESDYAVLAVPLTPETTKLIGPAQLASMKPGAILINVARGEVVDEAALVRALQEGPIGGAALDVFEREPLPPDSPLWGMPNVLVSPHVSGSSAHYDDLAADIFADNLRRYLAGEPLRNRVDPVLGY